MKLNESERLNLSRLGAEVRAATAEYGLKQKEAAEYLRKVDPEDKYHQLLQDVLLAQQTVNRSVIANNVLVDAIGARLKIDLRKHAFDPETGVLRELPSAPAK
jgi:hypothetical protein